MSETKVPSPVSHPDPLGQDSAERIRRSEVSRTLRKMDLLPGQEEAIERLSRSLVAKLLHGPVSKVVARQDLNFPQRASRGSRGFDERSTL